MGQLYKVQTVSNLDPLVRLQFSARGGWASLLTIPDIDFRRHPNTILLHALRVAVPVL